jgi:hypothetical protein
MNGFRLVKILVVIVLTALALVVAPLSAHGDREVGEYVIVFGWRVEPTYTDLFNGPEFTVAHHETEEAVEGLADTLELEVSFGSASKTLILREDFFTPGHYTADLIPTRPGDYSFHLTGMIGDTPVDETFNSADGEFSTVEPIDDIRFP